MALLSQRGTSSRPAMPSMGPGLWAPTWAGSLRPHPPTVRAACTWHSRLPPLPAAASASTCSPPPSCCPRPAVSDVLDVMGCSHCSTSTINAFHALEPTKPYVMSECCSCETQRGEDADQPHNDSTVFYSNLNWQCVAGQTQVSNAPAWVAGTFVWTLHDYYGACDGVGPHRRWSRQCRRLRGASGPKTLTRPRPVAGGCAQLRWRAGDRDTVAGPCSADPGVGGGVSAGSCIRGCTRYQRQRSLANCRLHRCCHAGEPDKWPHISSSFGSYDLAGCVLACVRVGVHAASAPRHIGAPPLEQTAAHARPHAHTPPQVPKGPRMVVSLVVVRQRVHG